MKDTDQSGGEANTPSHQSPLFDWRHTMLFLTEKLLNAAGIKYDVILDTWIVPMPLPPVVTVECDESGDYIMEAMLEVHSVLHAVGCSYTNFAVSRGYLSLVGLRTMALAAVA
jgi:hypothetical protein